MKLFICIFALVFTLVGAHVQADSFIRLKNLEVNTTTLGPVYALDATGKPKGTRFAPSTGRLYYIIQFSGPVQQAWKSALESKGVEISSYIPDNAFIAKIATAQGWAAVNNSRNVQAVLPYEVEYRVSEDLSTPSVFNKDQGQAVLVQIISPNFMNEFLVKLQAAGIQNVAVASEKTVYVESTLEKVREVARIEGVEWVEPALEFRTFDFDASSGLGDILKKIKDRFKKKPKPDPNKPGQPEQPPQDPPPEQPLPPGEAPGEAEKPKGDYTDLTGFETGTKLMGFDTAWAKGFHGEGEIVGIADTGLDRGSTEEILKDFQGQVIKGYARGLLSKGWEDYQGHGTHTAGSIVSTGAESGGILKGGAYGAKIVVEGLWSKALKNLLMLPMDFRVLFQEPHRNDGVTVHSNSWGSASNAYDISSSNVDTIMWNNPELLLVFAAGNAGQDFDKDGHIDTGSVSSPSTAKNCLTVGASKNQVAIGGIQKPMGKLKNGDKKWGAEPLASSKLSDNPNGMAPFSSIGPTRDGRIKPDLVAPGTNIISAHSQVDKASTLWGEYNQYYSYAGGTSMATPLTAGAAVVTRQYLKKVSGQSPSSALVKAVMIHTAHDLYPGQFGMGEKQELQVRRPNPNEGFGRVDVAAVVEAPYSFSDDRVGLQTGEVKNIKLNADNIKAGQKVRVTLVYNDAPGGTSAKGSLVNDLDLRVIGASGESYYPNHLSAPDKKNNVEMVEFDAEAKVGYTIEVSGANVPQNYMNGGQPYALVWQYK